MYCSSTAGRAGPRLRKSSGSFNPARTIAPRAKRCVECKSSRMIRGSGSSGSSSTSSCCCCTDSGMYMEDEWGN